jgi:hypothetical protein
MPPTHDLDPAAIEPRRKFGLCHATSDGAGRGETVGPAITRSLTTLRLSAVAAAFAASAVFLPAASHADEGGTSFWVPGTFGSFAAVSETPGWSLTITNYFTSTNAGDDVATARAISTGRISPTVRLDGTSSYTSRYDTVSFNPSYAFATAVLGGQFSIGVTVPIGSQTVGLDRALTLASGASTAPMAQIHWSSGVNNWMTYATRNVPVGTYNARDLANIGIGHGAIDGGGGYTYYDAKKGAEFSVVTGLTYNFIDPSTSYQNGVDWQVDWALSQSVSKDIYVGAVGYFYEQISPDSGAGDHVGAFESRVMGIGPQINFTHPAGPLQAALNLKAYWEFDAAQRPSGWNAWATLSLSPNEPAADKPRPAIVTK